MKSLHFILVFCLLSFGLQAQQNFTLEEAVQYAFQNSNQIRLAQLESISAEAQIQEVRSAAIPKLSGTVDYQHNISLPKSLLPAEFFGGAPGTFSEISFGLKNNLTANLNANAIIFDPTVFIGIKAARVYRELVTKQRNQTTFELRYNVEKAYLAILIAEKNKEIIQDNISNLEEILRETTAIYKEGFAEKLDVDRLQLSLDNLNVQKENIEQLAVLSYNVLKFQMGYPLEEDITLDDDLDALVSATLVDYDILLGRDLDVQQRPEYSTIKAGEALNQKNIESIKASNYPSLYAFGTHQQSLQRDDIFDGEQPGWLDATIIGAKLNVPIFDGFTNKYKLQQAEVDLKKTQLQLNDFVRAANLEFQNAKTAYLNSKRIVDANLRTLELAKRIYNTTQIKYKEGVGSSLEVTQAENELYQAQGNYINSLYDLLVAKTDLEKALGDN